MAIVPNCIQIDTHRYLDKNEVTNKSYYWFVMDSEKSVREELYPSVEFRNLYEIDFNEMKPDDDLMNKPVIGVSLLNCIAFCKWRSAKVNAKYPNQSIQFQLPKRTDYEVAQQKKVKKENKEGVFGYNERFLNRNSHCFLGLENNVSELLENGEILGTESYVGFRCVAVVN